MIMKKSRLLSMICVGIFLVTQTVSFEVAADFLSQVNTHGELFDPTTETVGGWDVRTTQLSNFGSDVLDVGGTRSISAWTLASARTGRLAFNLSSSITVDADAPQGRLSAFVQSTNNRVIDDFTIGPGGGLVNGDLAQVRLQVQLDGDVQVQGRPSGGTQFAFSVRAGAGTTNLPLVADFNTGGLNPPQAFEVHEQWDIIVDVVVGGKMRVDTLMSGWINGTAFDPGLSGTNFLDFDPIFNVSNLPGFNLSIVSDANPGFLPGVLLILLE